MSLIKEMRSRILLVTVLLSFLILIPGLSYAESLEPFMLHGIVSDIDMKSKTVTVDVTTSGCIGIRTFSFRDIDKRSFKTGDKVNFFIDSETCNGIGSDRIRDLWRVK